MKFKVWCKNKLEWESDPCYLSESGYLFQICGRDRLAPLNPEIHIPVFSPGLRDRKRTEEYPEGQEVYAGDILQYTGEYGHVAIGVVRFGKFNEYSRSVGGNLSTGGDIGFYIDWQNDGANYWGDWWRKDMLFWLSDRAGGKVVVIGNIYDHPSMLETESC